MRSLESAVITSKNNIRICPIVGVDGGVIIRAKHPFKVEQKWKAAAFCRATGTAGMEMVAQRVASLKVM